MEANGKGMTEQDLKELPEVFNVVLWQDDDGPCNVFDSDDVEWEIGFFKGILSKCKSRISFVWEHIGNGTIRPVLRKGTNIGNTRFKY